MQKQEPATVCRFKGEGRWKLHIPGERTQLWTLREKQPAQEQRFGCAVAGSASWDSLGKHSDISRGKWHPGAQRRRRQNSTSTVRFHMRTSEILQKQLWPEAVKLHFPHGWKSLSPEAPFSCTGIAWDVFALLPKLHKSQLLLQSPIFHHPTLTATDHH